MHAQSLQSCLTLCNPMDCSLPGSSVHGISPGKNTGVVCYALLQGIFLTQELNLSLLWLLHCRWILYHWATRETLVALDFIYPVQAIHPDTLAFLNPNPERQERESTWPAKIEHPSLGWLWWLKDTELLRSTPVLRGTVLRQGESRYWLSHCVQLSGY